MFLFPELAENVACISWGGGVGKSTDARGEVINLGYSFHWVLSHSSYLEPHKIPK